MKTIKIPDYRSPYEVIVNGVKQIYSAGATVEVADEIADIIEASEAARLPEAPAPEIPAAIQGANMALNELKANGQIGYTTMGEVVPETEMTGADGSFVAEMADPHFEVGKSYTVVIDGVSYDTTGKLVTADGDTIVMLGNAGLMELGEDTEEPFVGYYNSSGLTLISLNHPTESSITVSVAAEITHTIDPKYLPCAVLPVVEIADVENITAEENAKLTACMGMPCIIKNDVFVGVFNYANDGTCGFISANGGEFNSDDGETWTYNGAENE